MVIETNTQAMQKPQKHATILGIKLTSTSKNQLLEEIKEKITKKEKFYVVTPNPEIVLSATKDQKLKEIINLAGLSIPDGFGLKLFEPGLTIMKGRELMVDLIGLAHNYGWKVYFLGATEAVNRKTIEIAQKKYTGAKFTGGPGPILNNNGQPVSEKEKEIEGKVIREINNFSPNILFVAFGSPKEILWMGKHFDELKPNCMMQVGGSLDYFTGQVKSAPVLVTSLNLEWLWRGLQEPWRVGRIFNAVVAFPLKVLISKLKISI